MPSSIQKAILTFLFAMKTKQLIESWKNADANQQGNSPASNVDVNEFAMSEIIGGANSAGAVCSVSGECNLSGKSCNLIDAFFAIFI